MKSLPYLNPVVNARAARFFQVELGEGDVDCLASVHVDDVVAAHVVVVVGALAVGVIDAALVRVIRAATF